MKLRITEFTWVHTSLFALSVALVASACDDPDAVTEEDLTVESMEETVQDEALDELSDEAEEGPGDAVEERGWKNDDDDDKGWKWKRDDDDKGWKWKRDDDDNGWKWKRDDDDDKGWKWKRDDDDNKW